MARQPSIIRQQKINLSLPEDIYARLNLHLYSDIEGCVPRGAYQKFFIERIQEYFSKEVIPNVNS
jgi:hypothetical protein